MSKNKVKPLPVGKDLTRSKYKKEPIPTTTADIYASPKTGDEVTGKTLQETGRRKFLGIDADKLSYFLASVGQAFSDKDSGSYALSTNVKSDIAGRSSKTVWNKLSRGEKLTGRDMLGMSSQDVLDIRKQLEADRAQKAQETAYDKYLNIQKSEVDVSKTVAGASVAQGQAAILSAQAAMKNAQSTEERNAAVIALNKAQTDYYNALISNVPDKYRQKYSDAIGKAVKDKILVDYMYNVPEEDRDKMKNDLKGVFSPPNILAVMGRYLPEADFKRMQEEYDTIINSYLGLGSIGSGSVEPPQTGTGSDLTSSPPTSPLPDPFEK